MKLFYLAFAGVLYLASFAGDAFAQAADHYLTIQLKNGPVVIQLMPEVAPKHVAQIEALAKKGEYDNVAFHRVIEGFMAQTGDVKYGNMEKGFDASLAGTGSSDMPDIPAEFSKTPFVRGTVGMARSQDPNSANSQFFIMFADGSFLNGQYTVVGKVVSGMENVDKIKRGEGQNGEVKNPDRMIKVTLGKK
ncbi:cyclophilin-type peptidylprolyl cis-trans isomerase 1 [Rhizobium phaseoli]|uniref:Peptidyl-prolyl cis-trans isomerase n=3 Tax=Rhizobium TaxID=379 RepID=A0A192TB32_9HYPH|nr:MULTISPECIES: peptidylprolyl isomerase [Rhizobium]ACE91124.1 peptidyl-prolyl cis-trans isomerase A signal peptide protein [Rhizobium etli CIAT 652]ANL27958.1 cyclophilin-type peptidylprolyl cis-trans isomerase 1 [Rhizobium phaseoli]ANL40575.1 cyclophilin-type peptidylprolyl cis-trans isomerase 1 [Rhizobium phaseoli]ANL53310.1 cyclophilin-type peptidylprolyl cis-trans isomerase 1 [Rhizobium phaseoli]ANL59563.1 cyclophilin-type peptidylprolyl cis-trans isomerase 1 [Rhizobium phaseoli]